MNRSEDEAMEEETEDETQRMKKMRLTTTTNNVGGATSSKPTRKTGRKKDEVWNHVDELEHGGFRCKYCKNKFSGGASRIKEHLRLPPYKDRGNIKGCPNYTPTSRTSSTERENQYDPNPTLPLSRSPPHDLQRDHVDPIVPSETNLSSFQSEPHPNVPISTSLELDHGTSNSEVQLKSLAKYLLVNNLPIDTIKEPHFQTLINLMHEFPSTIEVSLTESRSSLRTEVERYIQIVKESWSETGLTLKVHFRKTRYNEVFKESNIVGYIAYCPKGVIFLDFQKTCNEIKKDMKNELTQIIYDLDLEKDDCHGTTEVDGIMSTTHCANVSLCVQALIINFLHTICEECDGLVDLIKEAKRMYEDVITRTGENPTVASMFDHYPFFELQTIVQHKEKFESALGNQSETSEFWKDMEEALRAVGPLIQILNLFDSFVPNIGYFFEAMEMVEQRIKHYPEKFKLLRERFGSLKSGVVMPIHLTTAYLNPSYMHDGSSIKEKINDKEVKEHIRDLVFISEEDQTILENELARYNKRDSSLFTEEAIRMLKQYHPVIWWKKFG